LNSSAPGTVGILLVTSIVSLLGLYGRPQLIERSLFRPYELVRNSRYYTLVSSGLVHGSLTHLLFNMLTFYFFGPPLERSWHHAVRAPVLDRVDPERGAHLSSTPQ